MIVADRSVEFTATVVIAGISIVLGVLLLLIFVFFLFGKIVSGMENRNNKKKAAAQQEFLAKKENTVPMPKAPVAPKAPIAAPVVEQGISGEVVAAITAAVVASSGPTAVVRSIQKKNVGSRNPWASAATFDNTRPF